MKTASFLRSANAILTLCALLLLTLSSPSAFSQQRVRATGYNASGQLGNGTNFDRSTPLQTSGLTNLTAIACGFNHSLAVKSDGTVWAWGMNNTGTLGDGTFDDHYTPVQVVGLTNAIRASGGGYQSLAVKSDGTVWTWGDNSNGQLGDGTTTGRPYAAIVTGLSGVADAVCGSDHCLAVKNNGTVWAWGSNSSGQLGDGTTTQREAPVQVTGLTNVIRIAGGNNHSLAVKSNGTVWAWGDNAFGELGNGTTNNSSTPVQVTGLSNIVSVSAGYFSSVALKSDGTVWVWGYTGSGPTPTPIQMDMLSNVTFIASGASHNVAVKSDGTAWAWGDDTYGQLGDGTNNTAFVPVQIVGVKNARAAAAGGQHTLILVSKDDDPDFNFDRSHDLVWQNGATGDSVAWYLQGAVFNNSYGYIGQAIPTEWSIAASADLDGDGFTDLIWYNSRTGDVSYWLMNGTQRVSSDYIAQGIPLDWKIVAVGDFNADGSSDLVWQNTRTGDVTVWYMDRAVWYGGYDFLAHGIPSQWKIAGSADFNADGNTDLVWENSQTGDVTVWFMNGNQWNGSYSYIAAGIPLAWKVAAIMDVDNNGKADLIWENAQTGDVVVWYMNGAAFTGNYGYIAQGVPQDWKVARTH